MKKLLILLGVVAAFLFSGCASTNYYTSVSKTKTNDAVRDQIVITDLLNFVRGYYPPAKTQFYIDRSYTPTNKAFGDRLEQSFRSVGYGITYDLNSAYCVPFAWKIDDISSNIVRATFVIDNATISKLYQGSKGSYRPISPYTVRGLAKTPPYKVDGINEISIDFSLKDPEDNNVSKTTSPSPTYSFLKSSKSSSLSKSYKGGGLLTRIIATALNVREKPTTHSKILRTYKKGTYIKVSKKVKNDYTEYWYKLQNYKGYVSAKYVKKVRG